LDYAHRHNVIHRDIKPENILLHDGQPLVADFGIALAVSAAGGTRLTETGLSLGTPHYMSPEQATGDRELDGRSDIYSLACVLYEMLAGDPPHTGSTVQAVIAKVVTDRPREITDLRDTVPPHVAAALQKALAKLPADRFGDASAFTDALTGRVKIALGSSRHVARSSSLRPVQVVPWLLAGILAAALALVWLGNASEDAAVRRWNIALPDSAAMVFVGEASLGVGVRALDISPDGRHVVYVGSRGPTTQLYVRSTDGFAVRALPGTEGAFAPFFSPDGREVAFLADDQLKRTVLTGGAVSVLMDTPDGMSGSWSDDGRIAVIVRDGVEALVLTLGSGAVQTVRLGTSSSSPHWLPGSERLLVTCDAVNGGLCALDPATGSFLFLSTRGQPRDGRQPVGDEAQLLGWAPRLVADGIMVFAGRGGNTARAVRIDPGSFRVLGDPLDILAGVRREAFLNELQYAVSRSGTLVYASGENANIAELVWVDRDGHEEPLGFEARAYGAFALAPDGRRVVIQATSQAGVPEMWLYDLERGTERRWVGEYTPVTAWSWHPNSRELYATFLDDRVRILRVDADAFSGGTLIYQGDEMAFVESVAPDGHLAVQWIFQRFVSLLSEDETRDAGPTGSREAERTIPQSGAQLFASVSPDGRWLAYSSAAEGRYEIWAVPYPELGTPIRLSTEGGELPQWSIRGDGLYYRDGRRWYWVSRQESETEPFALPEQFAEGTYLNIAGPEHAVSPDGERLLVLRGLGRETTTTLNVVTNWLVELESKVGR
jgi:serine/threonine-protein kinase